MGRALWLLPLASLAIACGGHGPPKALPPPHGAGAAPRLIEVPDRPRVAAVVREGDPSFAVAAYAIGTGLDQAAGDAPAIAVGALLEARLAALHPRVSFDPGVVRVAILVDSAKEAEDAAARVAGALLGAYAAKDDERTVVERKLAALAALPPVAPTAAGLAACDGRLRPATRPIAAADVEAFRSAIATQARVAFGATGPIAIAEGVAAGLRGRAAWPAGSAAPASALPATSEIVDASNELGPGRARLTVSSWGAGDRATARAARVADQDAPLRARVFASDSTAGVDGARVVRLGDHACTTVELRGATSSLFGTMALARRELVLAEEDAAADATAPTAGDPRDSAELGAASALPLAPQGDLVATRVFVGGDPRAKSDAGMTALANLDRDVAAAEASLARPALDVRTALEPGQPELVVLLASPCGSAGESEDDAGLGALAVTAAATPTDDVALEPFVAADALGVLARATPHPGESIAALGRRVAAALARRLLVEAPDDLARARAMLARDADRALVHLGRTLAPKRPSTIVAQGTPDALLHASDALALTRLDGLRHGPLRAAALVNGDAAAASAVAAAVDRWAPRTFGGTPPACVEPPPSTAPKPGSYVIDAPASEAYLALAIDPHDYAAATALAAWLDAGALSRAVNGLARSASARVLGSPRSPFFVVHLDAPDAALDGAVAQTRVLLDRLHTKLEESDAKAALAALAASDRAARLDARHRIVELFRGPLPAPTTDAVRAFAATLHDDALVIAATRPHAPKAVKP